MRMGVSARILPCLVVAAAAGALSLSAHGCGGGSAAQRRDGLDIAVSDLVVPAAAAAGATIQVSVTVHNRGTIPGSPAVAFVLSVVPDVAATDMLLNLVLPTLIIEPGRSIPITTTVSLPDNLGSGRYFVGAVAPPADGEVTPSDNAASAPVQVSG